MPTVLRHVATRHEPEEAMSRSKRHGRGYWTRLVAEYEQGPTMGKKEFAAERGLHPGTFESWWYKLRRERRETQHSASTEIRLVEVAVPERGSKDRVEAGSKALSAGDSPRVAGQVEVALPSGISLRFDTNAPPRYLGELVAAIEGKIQC
jgi:hypothetical protein